MKTISKTTMRIFVTSLAITTGLAAHAATDGEGGGKMRHERPAFSTLDTNGDGALTRAEMEAHSKARFDRQDTNGNGLLSKDELTQQGKQRAEKRAGKMLKRADANGDGLLSFEEMSSGKRGDRMGKMFERADADKDGTISEAEFAEMAKHRGKRAGKMRGGE